MTNDHCPLYLIPIRRKVRNIVRAGAVLHGESGAVAREEDRRCDWAEAAAELCRGADNREVSCRRRQWSEDKQNEIRDVHDFPDRAVDEILISPELLRARHDQLRVGSN